MPHAPTDPNLLGRSSVMRARTEVGRRYRQVRRIWRENGVQLVLDRVRRGLADQLAPTVTPLPVRPTDVLACDLTVPRNWVPLPMGKDERLTVNWVTTPPTAGSGGHTTMFRLIEHLERSGHLCRVYLYDVYGGDATYYASVVREVFPGFRGRGARCYRRHGRRPCGRRDVLGYGLPRVQRSMSRNPLLSRPGLRAVVLPGGGT